MPKREAKSPTAKTGRQTSTRKRATQSTPPHEDIARRAYEIYLERGGAAGGETEDWLQAERELRQRDKKTGD